MENLSKIGFGGGCHWCTEAVFLSLKGVKFVEQGWIKSVGEEDTFSEAVVLQFSPEQIPLSVLIEIHLRTHKSMVEHSMRKKYRSAIYWFEEGDKEEIQKIVYQLQDKFPNPIITQVLPFVGFKPSEEEFRNYYYKNPQKPFCKTYIHPKLNLLLNQFTDYTEISKINLN